MARLGSENRPAVVRVETFEEADAVVELCNRRGWKVIVGIEPGKPENLKDLTRLMGRPVRSQDLLEDGPGTERRG